jgi:MFS family permease
MMSMDVPAEATQINIKFSNVANWGFIGKYSLTISTVGLGAGVIVLYFNLFFKNEFGANSELIGIIFAINMVVLALGNFLAPALSDKLGKVRTIIITEALSIPFLLMISFADYLSLAVLAYVSRNVLMNMAGPVSNAFFMEGLQKEERATAMGVTRAGDSLVRGIAANIGGGLLAAGLYRLPYILVSGLYFVSVIMFYLFFRNKEKELQARKDAELIKVAKPKETVDIT